MGAYIVVDRTGEQPKFFTGMVPAYLRPAPTSTFDSAFAKRFSSRRTAAAAAKVWRDYYAEHKPDFRPDPSVEDVSPMQIGLFSEAS
ncbi:MAG: hypothetical protein AAF661_05200 [Pseudomonadota bacterium]